MIQYHPIQEGEVVGLSKCCRSVAVDLFLIVALKVHIFIRVTRSNFPTHDFQATRWNLGAEFMKRQHGREESPDINLLGHFCWHL